MEFHGGGPERLLFGRAGVRSADCSSSSSGRLSGGAITILHRGDRPTGNGAGDAFHGFNYI